MQKCPRYRDIILRKRRVKVVWEGFALYIFSF